MKQLLERFIQPKVVLVCTILLYFMLLITNGVPFIYSDGFGSFHTTQCIINEFNFACSEEPEYYPEYSTHTVTEFQDKFVTVYAPGSALMQLPGQLLAEIFTNTDSYTDSFVAANGHSIAQGSAFVLTSMIVSLFSLVLMYKALRNYEVTNNVAIFATFASFTSSYAIWYVFLQSGFNHTTEIFGLTLQLFGMSLLHQKKNVKSSIFLALGVGIATLARPPLVISGVLIGLYLLIKRYWREVGVYVAVGFPFALLYLAYNKISYGDFFVSSYGLLFNQTFEFETWNFHQVLFSPFRGWFIYSPAYLFAITGLIVGVFYKKFRYESLLALITIFFTAGLYGFWPMWWGGGSYGQRFMISFVPFLALGFALLFVYARQLQLNKKLLFFAIGLLTMFTITTTILYRFTPVTDLRPIDDRVGIMTSGDRYRIWDIYNYHVDSIKDADSFSSYASSLAESVSGGHSYLSYFAGFGSNIVRIDSREENSPSIKIIEDRYSNKAIPDTLSFIVHSTKLNEAQRYTVNLTSRNTIQFECNELCTVRDEDVIVEVSNLENSVELSDANYGGFDLNENHRIYIEYLPDLYFKGDRIRLGVFDNTYNIQIR